MLPLAPIDTSIATDAQRSQPRRQDSIPPPPRRRDSQPPASPKDAEVISGLDPIAESTARDNKRLLKRLIKPIEELNKTVQIATAERDFYFAHNAEGGMIRLPDMSHDQNIHQAVRELLEGGNSAMLRRFQETSMKMNQIITVSGVVTGRRALT